MSTSGERVERGGAMGLQEFLLVAAVCSLATAVIMGLLYWLDPRVQSVTVPHRVEVLAPLPLKPSRSQVRVSFSGMKAYKTQRMSNEVGAQFTCANYDDQPPSSRKPSRRWNVRVCLADVAGGPVG